MVPSTFWLLFLNSLWFLIPYDPLCLKKNIGGHVFEWLKCLKWSLCNMFRMNPVCSGAATFLPTVKITVWQCKMVKIQFSERLQIEIFVFHIYQNISPFKRRWCRLFWRKVINTVSSFHHVGLTKQNAFLVEPDVVEQLEVTPNIEHLERNFQKLPDPTH